eukprot:142416_1
MPSNHNIHMLKGNSKVMGYESSRSKADITLDTDPDLFDKNFCTTNIQKSFATLQYQLTWIDICIQAVNYNTIVLKALPYKSTIADIKERIASQECLPKQYQVLKWNNQILRDDISLQALILSKSSSPLLLELKPMSLVVHTNFGDDIEIKTLTCFDTVKHVKDMIRDSTGIEKEVQQVWCRGDMLCDDSRLTLPVINIDTVTVPLRFRLQLRLSRIAINVKTVRSLSLVKLTVALDDTVQTIKKMINKTRKFNSKTRILIFGEQELQNDTHLFDYKLKDDDTVYVNSSNTSVFMFHRQSKNSKVKYFDMQPYDQIKDLKDEWRTECGHKHLVYFAKQQLMDIAIRIGPIGAKIPIAIDEDLVDHHKLATFSVLFDGTVTVYVSGLELILRKETTISNATALKHTRQAICCTKWMKIAFVKDLLSRKTKMCTELQILIFNGEELRDEDCLADYGIENGSEIQLECREETPALSVCAHDQGRRSVCYAYAIATVLRAAENRIIGRNPPKHNVIANQLIWRYGENGAVSSDVLRKECPSRQLRCKAVSKESTMEALDRGHVLLGVFHLDDGQWKRFGAFFEDERTKSQVIRKVDIGHRDGSKDDGHAVAIYSCGYNEFEDVEYYRIKNSWGRSWAEGGFAKIGTEAITLKVYHVYYVQHDLTHEDLVNYQKFVKAP